MEAIDYLKESNRMCESFENCHECPLNMASRKYEETCRFMTKTHPAEVVEVIEQWSKEHPIITNVRKFKEVFGVLPTDYVMGRSRETWWDKPYKEPKHDG